MRWCCRYALSYGDLEEMMAERGIEVAAPNRASIHVGITVVMAAVVLLA